MRILASALALLSLTACGTTMPNFGSLTADGRTLQITNQLELIEVSNGLKVLFAPDDRTNLVSVDVRYGVGAAQDPRDRAGLAHLIEHLTFAADAGDGASLFDRLAALSLYFNAYTDHDVTHYFARALAGRVDALLELEARRMVLDCDSIPAGVFARARDVVLAEAAQDRTAWTDTRASIDRAVWGADHPYARPIASREVADVGQAEACAFHRAYYAPDRALMVVSGHFDPRALQQRIGRRFGPITRRATGELARLPEPPLTGESSHHGDVEHPTALIYLPAPPWGAEDQAVHDVLLDALAGALAELDDETPWLVSAAADYTGAGRQRATVIQLEVSEARYLDQAVDAALRAGRELFQDDDHDGHADDLDDPDDADVKRAIAAYRGRRQTRTVVSGDRFVGRGIELADYLTYTRTLRFAIGELEATDALTGARLVAYAQAFFRRDNAHVALVTPTDGGHAAALPALDHGERTYDVEPWRSPVDPAEAARPLALSGAAPHLEVQELRLTNGLRVLLHADPASPIVDARLVFPAGTLDEPDDHRGVAQVAARLLEQDTDRQYPRAIVDKLNWAINLGTQLYARAGDEATVFQARGLAVYADWHVWRLAWLIDQGVYTPASVTAFRRDVVEDATREASAWGRAFAARLYGLEHPYARPPADAFALGRLDVATLAAWRRGHFVMKGATLVVSGGFDPVAMRREIGELFGDLPGRAPAARPAIPPPVPAKGPSWIGARLADASQVKLYVSFAAASDAERDRAARTILAAVLSDRLRMVRERLGASYGASAGYDGPGPGELDIVTSLEPDRAIEAARAVLSDLAALRERPDLMAADLVRARRRLVGDALATVTDASATAQRLESIVRRGGDLAAGERQAAALAAITLDDVAAVAREDLDPARMVVSVRGPGEPVKATLAALGATDIAWFDE
jgi:zinc protease